jgi:hypothetical protein
MLGLTECSYLGEAPVLANKYYTCLEKLASDKHSSLIGHIASDEEKGIYKIAIRYFMHLGLYGFCFVWQSIQLMTFCQNDI